MAEVAKLLFWLFSCYGGFVLGRDLAAWLWAKTHPDYRLLRFETYTGKYWRLNGSRVPLEASRLTDLLQSVHDETAVPPLRKQALTRELGKW